MAKTSQLVQSIVVDPGDLPKLVEKIGTFDSEKQRIACAEGAYFLYGVRLTYLTQDGRIVSYAPTEQEMASRQKLEQGNAEALKAKTQLLIGIQRSLDYLPYFFAIYIGTFFLAFCVGLFWVVFKKPAEESNLQS